MLKKVLIANRGEIACRILRTARRLGIATVAVYSEADRRAAHVEEADEAVAIGPAPPAESYLRIDSIIAAATARGADCIHPGNGFLSENAAFSEACRKAGIVFIGPSPEAMRALGDKGAAKALAESLGVPVVPGFRGDGEDARALAEAAARLGFPVVIKAAAGGGGRGMRVVEREADFAAALESAKREAGSAFGDDRVLLEKLIERPRHVEVQVFGDRLGNLVHLFERDCSLQRRHQKVIEEAPAPGISPELRQALTGAAVLLTKAASYEGAGTIEFLVGGGSLAAEAPWYFIEANTRLQVEHPVTEEVTGLDLVEWQFRVAAGEPLPLRQEEIRLRGHAVEARLYAEDPAAGFLPSAGRVVECRFEPAQGMRFETGVRPGDEITPYYDPMIAKIIASGAGRDEALDRLSSALANSVVIGPSTNAAFLKALADHPLVREGRLDTSFIAREISRLAPAGRDEEAIRIGIRELLALDGRGEPDFGEVASPWQGRDGFQLGGERRQARDVVVDGKPLRVEIAWRGGEEDIAVGTEGGAGQRGARTHIRASDGRIHVLRDLMQTVVAWPVHGGETAHGGAEGGVIRAPINGRITKLFISEGSRVVKGDRIGIVEAMKMEHVLLAPRGGRVLRLEVVEGQQVTARAVVAEIEPEEGE